MNIEIPGFAEPYLRARAAADGFTDAGEYVLRRVLFDDDELARMRVAASGDDVGRLLQEAIDSGPPTPLTPDDFDRWRALARSVT